MKKGIYLLICLAAFQSFDAFGRAKDLARLLEQSRAGRFYVTQLEVGNRLVQKILGRQIRTNHDYAEFLKKLKLHSDESIQLFDDLLKLEQLRKQFQESVQSLQKERSIFFGNPRGIEGFRSYLARTGEWKLTSQQGFMPAARARNSIWGSTVFRDFKMVRLDEAAIRSLDDLSNVRKTFLSHVDGGVEHRVFKSQRIRRPSGKLEDLTEEVTLFPLYYEGPAINHSIKVHRTTHTVELQARYQSSDTGVVVLLKGKQKSFDHVIPVRSGQVIKKEITLQGQSQKVTESYLPPRVIRGANAGGSAKRLVQKIQKNALDDQTTVIVVIEGQPVQLRHLGSKRAVDRLKNSDQRRDYFGQRIVTKQGDVFDVVLLVRRKNSSVNSSEPFWEFSDATIELVVRRPR